MEKLPGDYIAGFVDGEGCFALKFRRDIKRERKNQPVYFYWDIEFVIVLREDDKEILEQIKETLECGRIHNPNKYGSIRYTVNDINDLLNKVIPFFEKYPLRAKKRFDFDLWKEAVIILNKNKGLKTNISTTGNPRGNRKNIWNYNDLKKLKQIYNKMIIYKSKGRGLKWIDKIA